jgi:hypothetical protein
MRGQYLTKRRLLVKPAMTVHGGKKEIPFGLTNNYLAVIVIVKMGGPGGVKN